MPQESSYPRFILSATRRLWTSLTDHKGQKYYLRLDEDGTVYAVYPALDISVILPQWTKEEIEEKIAKGSWTELKVEEADAV